jgi:polygalacturonase
MLKELPMRPVPILCGLLALSACATLHAQDTRNVTEPKLPPACVALDAQLTSVGHDLAPGDESKLDSARIQKALEGCGKGKGVYLNARGSVNAFLTGPLQLPARVALVVGKGVTLYGSRDPQVYETAPGSCGLVNDAPGRGCKPLIAVDNVAGASVMGEGTIDGRGGDKLLGKDVTWWELAEQARTSGRQQVPRILVANKANDFTLYQITLKNSPNFHVVYNGGDGFTVWGLKINTPKRLARNTDGVDPGDGAKNVTIIHSWIRTGDDNVAIKGGTGGATHMTIAHNHFYWGHGMSIGSETNGGVSAIRVTDLSLDGPDNGIRIKSNGSRGGLTHDVVYEDVCVRNSPNPITLDTGYSAAGTLTGNLPPTMKDVTLRNVRISGGGKISFNGYTQQYRVGANLDNVLLTDIDTTYTYSLHHADLHLGPGPVNLQLKGGVDTTITGTAPTTGKAASCKDKFAPFPEP